MVRHQEGHKVQQRYGAQQHDAGEPEGTRRQQRPNPAARRLRALRPPRSLGGAAAARRRRPPLPQRRAGRRSSLDGWRPAEHSRFFFFPRRFLLALPKKLDLGTFVWNYETNRRMCVDLKLLYLLNCRVRSTGEIACSVAHCRSTANCF